MIRKLFLALSAIVIASFFATSVLAQSGITCEEAIPVGENYEGKIDAPCTLWYTASTYDLPLHVYFVPDSAGSLYSPELYVDFTCTPGVYDDPKLDSLLTKMSIFGVELPLEFMCDLVTYQGRNAWELSISNTYREELSEAGITYDVPAYVQVKFSESGSITMTPDTIFSSCLESSKTVRLGDTLEILPNDSSTVYILPYTDWKKDSIRFVWEGENSARVWLATDNCDFTPVTISSYVWGYYDVAQGLPYNLQVDDVKGAIEDSQNGGIFFSKILSPTAGKLVIETIPETPPAGGAILLEYDKEVSVAANTDQLYAFPKTWNTATMFQPSPSVDFQVQICNSHDFSESVGVYVNTYGTSTYDEYAVHLTSLDMNANTKNAKDNYMYVRFVSDQSIDVTPRLWEVSPCIDNSRSINANEVITMTSSGASYYYRLNYEEYKGYDLTVKWVGSSRMSFYVGDTCNFDNSSSDAHVIHNKTVNKNTSYTIPAATVDSWASSVDGDGYLYVRFSSVSGKITFLTDKPAPVLSPCVLGSTELALNSTLKLNLASVHTIYRINYTEWQAAGATLAWEGTSPLHTFLASTCTFPVAPHNRYVLDYEAVLPAGEKVMAADWLARMAQYVDEDGYLYIRFLTEFEGTLRVK